MKRDIIITSPSQRELMDRHNPTAKRAGEMKTAGVHGGRKPKYCRHPKHKRQESNED